MRTTKGNENRLSPFLCIQKFILFFIWHFTSVMCECETGLELTCKWVHDEKTALLWKMKTDKQEPYVELNCKPPNCGGIGIIRSPLLQPRDYEAPATIQYKVFGTSAVYFKLYMIFEDSTSPRQFFTKYGNYAYGYPTTWTSISIQLPATHIQHQLVLKALIRYEGAMVAVKDINLDGTVYITSSSSTTTSSTATTTSSSAPQIVISTSTTTTTTTTDNPVVEEQEISPIHYEAEINECSTKVPEASESIDNFPEDDEDEEEEENEIERRFQALELEKYIDEQDLIEGYTTVVEPQLCMYK